jgi:hypothetical protein
VTQGQVDPKAAAHQKAAADAKTLGSRPKKADMPKVVGKGWGSVVVASLPAPNVSGGTGGSAAGAEKQLAQLMRYVALMPKVSGSWGSGHLMAGTVFSALLTDDGRVVVGAVTPKGLYAALAAS